MEVVFNSWLTERIHQIKDQNLYRELTVMTSGPAPKVTINSQNQLVFSSNNYLGLAADERIIAASRSAAKVMGIGSSGSRLTTGSNIWHQRLEEKIASFKQTEAALLFSSGYLANIGVLSSLAEKGDVILSDELNHASIIDGCRLSKAKTVIYKHVHLKDLETKLKETQKFNKRFVVTDGVFSMDGNIAPLDQIISLAKAYNAFVIVDDAHGTGVLGANGRGICEYFGVQPDVLIGTLSKALGAEGGFVAGSYILKNFLLNHARSFIFQTALPPCICAASVKAFSIIEEDKRRRESLVAKSTFIRTRLRELGYEVKGTVTPIIPIIIGGTKEALNFSKRLRQYGIFAPAIRPPTVQEGESRIRLTVTAEHSYEDINQLIEAFKLLSTNDEVTK